MADLRPCIVKGKFYCSHASLISRSNIPDMVQYFIPDQIANDLGFYSGAEGASLEKIIYDVNKFTSTNNSEVIILKVSHAFNYDSEIRDEEWKYELDKTEWNQLLTALGKLNHLYISNQGARALITNVKIRDFVSSGHSAVIATTSAEPDDEFAGRGFFHQDVLLPLKAFNLAKEQTAGEAALAFIKNNLDDIEAPPAWKSVVKAVATDMEHSSILDRAKESFPGDYKRALATIPETSVCWNMVSADNVDFARLLELAIRNTSKAITSKYGPTLFPRQSGKWEFVEAAEVIPWGIE